MTFGMPAGTSKCSTGQRRTDGEELQPRIGVHGEGVTNRAKQRRVVDRVGVRVALVEVDAVVGRPLPHRVELAPGPHEPAVERAGEHAVGVGVPRCDDVIEAEQVGERTHSS